MFRYFATAFMAGAVLLTGTGAAADNLVRENRPIASVTQVALKGSGDLFITQGDRDELVVEADQSLLARIVTEVDKGRLTLSQKSSVLDFGKESKVKFYLTVKRLDQITLSGSGDIRVGSLVADNLEIASSGSGDVRIVSLTAQDINVRISGSSDIKLGGKVTNQKVKIAGSGDYAAPDLRSSVASIAIAGSGGALLWAADSLSVSIAGSGDVKYYGQPKVSQRVAGSGGIRGLGNR